MTGPPDGRGGPGGAPGPRPGPPPPPAPQQGLLAPMTVRTTGERIAERFVTAIALGQFVPGQRLPTERDLATMLGVSRATVREAIARLAESGYVTVRRGRAGGTFVVAGWGPGSAEMIRRTLSPEWLELEVLLDFRQVIEQQIARTAALRRGDADVKAIREALHDYEQAGADRDSSRMADLALHRAIADATHNPHLLNLSMSIRHDISFGFEAEPYSPEVRRRALHQHPELAQAVIEGNPDQAAELAADHDRLRRAGRPARVLGLKFGVRTTVILYLFEVVLLLALTITILVKGGANGLSAAPFKWPSGSGTKDIFVAFSFAVLAFGGFEAAAPLAEETRNPRRNVPFGVIGTVVVSGVLYVFCSYALIVAFGTGHIAQLAANPNPFQAAAKTFLPALAPLITWIFLSSVTSSYVAANTQTSRVIFAGARGGLWSRTLAAVSPRFRTPWAAAIAFVAPSILIAVVSTAFTDPGTAVGLLSTFGILGLILMYLAANVALIVQWAKFRRAGTHKNVWTWVVTPVIGVLVLAIPVWGDLRPGQPKPYSYLPWLTLALIAAGVIYMLVLRAFRPRVIEHAAALLEGDEEVPATA